MSKNRAMEPGLVSITFRQLAPDTIISLCQSRGLRAIEWGGAIHVPPGDLASARQVGEQTRQAGLSVAAYGSYYRMASPDGPDFSLVLAAAEALGAPVIRVWAGTRASADADSACRQAVRDDALRCADLAGKKNITVAYEHHGGTLTDTCESSLELLSATAHPFIKTLWQPPNGMPLDGCLADLRAHGPWIQHVHVFHWWPDASRRLPLDDGRDRWAAYIGELRLNGIECNMLLEFVLADDVAQLAADANCLKKLCCGEDC